MRTQGSRNRATPERRRAILDAALAEFLERGLEASSLASICQALGVTKGSLYHHFASKEELVVTLWGEAMQQLEQTTLDGLAVTGDMSTKIRALVRGYLRWFERHPRLGAFALAVLDSSSLEAKLGPLRDRQRRFVSAVHARLAPEVARGAVRAVPAQLFVPVVLGPARDFLRAWLRQPSRAAMREAKRHLPDAAWRALAPAD
jgi:AcrR family transcriptional regulator